ncbi:hypothetical protein Bca52824_065453 [Brassica carinata]|uniref:Uncharacterized protein n=1 Tax=Brassica carinata TaxID=52824 RepID=A0A8X7QJQ3_BRACI|nr:hypothetical protein Bca52824_065453 [Brassica carinata]
MRSLVAVQRVQLKEDLQPSFLYSWYLDTLNQGYAAGSEGWDRGRTVPIAVIAFVYPATKRITGSLGIHNEMPGNDMVSKVHVRCSSKGQVLIQRRRDHDRDLQAQAEPLGGGSFHGVSWRGRLEKLVMGSSFDTREAVREYLRSITGLDDESMSRPGVSRSVNKYKAHHKEICKRSLTESNS